MTLTLDITENMFLFIHWFIYAICSLFTLKYFTMHLFCDVMKFILQEERRVFL